MIALVNQKGGSGKTTTAVNLAACVAVSGRRVLLIDLDPQANATQSLGLDPGSLACTLYNVLVDHSAQDGVRLELSGVIIPSNVANLDLVPSSIDLAAAEMELSARMGRENVLRKKLDPVRHRYDCIFLDTPPSLGLLTLNALVACEEVIIPIQTHYYAFLGVRQLLRTLAAVREEVGHEIEIAGVVPTMYDARTNISREIVRSIHEFFGDKVFASTIHFDIKLVESGVAGVPVFIHRRSSRGAQEYMGLAKEVMALERAPRRAEAQAAAEDAHPDAQTPAVEPRGTAGAAAEDASAAAPAAEDAAVTPATILQADANRLAQQMATRLQLHASHAVGTALALLPPPDARAPAAPETRMVAVVDFCAPISLQTSEDALAQRIVADDLADLLARAAEERFAVIPRVIVEQAEAALQWRDEDALSTERLRALARAVGAGWLVVGWIPMLSIGSSERGLIHPPNSRRRPQGEASVVVRLFDAAMGRTVVEVQHWVSAVGDVRPMLAEEVLRRALEPTVSRLITALADEGFRYPAGTDSVASRCTIAPNSRRVRCPSASSNQ